MNAPVAAATRLRQRTAITLARAPEGYDAFVVADLVRALAREAENRAVALTFVARDSIRAQNFVDALAFAAPEIEALNLPAWDCQPYDRVSPTAAIASARMTALARLALTRGAQERPRVLVATVNAMTQRVPPRAYVAKVALSIAPGNALSMSDLVVWLESNGFSRASLVRDVGDYAQRGGILDLYPPALAQPLRLDFFGDTLESIRPFDPEIATQHRATALARPHADERSATDDRHDPPLPPGLRRRVRRGAARRDRLRGGQRGPPGHRPRTLAAAVLRKARHFV